MNLLDQRLTTQGVIDARFSAPADVIELLCAVQSQDVAGAKWSVGQRVSGGTDAIVQKAFDDGAFLRTHLLRPTWHFVLPGDIRWMLALTAPHVHALNAYQYRTLDLDARMLARAHTTIQRSLEGGNQLTRGELGETLREERIVAAGQRLAYIMMHAELEALVCSGATRGKEQTYALFDERVPPAKSISREDALGRLAHRFFTGHAPATVRHFAWWSGLPLKDARAGLAGVRDHLPAPVTDGQTEWFGVSTSAAKRGRLTAYLIPEYDESLTGAKDLGVVDMPRTKRAWKDFFFRPVIIGGKRAGTWRRTLEKNTARIETNLFTTLTPAEGRALDAAAKRYGEFLGMPVTVHPFR